MSTNLISLMDQLFDDGYQIASPRIRRSFSTSPALNVKEYEDKYEVSLQAPDIDSSKADIELHENTLTISYKEKKEDEKEDGTLLRQEYFQHLEFKRSLALPKNVNEDEIKAEYKKGVLKIEIKKLPENKPKKISIKNED